VRDCVRAYVRVVIYARARALLRICVYARMEKTRTREQRAVYCKVSSVYCPPPRTHTHTHTHSHKHTHTHTHARTHTYTYTQFANTDLEQHSGLFVVVHVHGVHTEEGRKLQEEGSDTRLHSTQEGRVTSVGVLVWALACTSECIHVIYVDDLWFCLPYLSTNPARCGVYIIH
jgi:hypothetical protein